jgi:hypothetical protein
MTHSLCYELIVESPEDCRRFGTATFTTSDVSAVRSSFSSARRPSSASALRAPSPSLCRHIPDIATGRCSHIQRLWTVHGGGEQTSDMALCPVRHADANMRWRENDAVNVEGKCWGHDTHEGKTFKYGKITHLL